MSDSEDRTRVSNLELAEGLIADFAIINPNSEKFENEVAKVQKRLYDYAAQVRLAARREVAQEIAEWLEECASGSGTEWGESYLKKAREIRAKYGLGAAEETK